MNGEGIFEALDALVTDVRNGWADPHTLRHAESALSEYRRMTTQQDSVSDVERLRAALEAQMEKQDEDLPNSIARERGLVWLEGWFDLSAALAVPINKIGEDAEQRLADALGREAALRDALDKLFVQALQSDVNDRSNDYGCEAIAIARAALHGSPAIRRLSTSTDKGVSNGR